MAYGSSVQKALKDIKDGGWKDFLRWRGQQQRKAHACGEARACADCPSGEKVRRQQHAAASRERQLDILLLLNLCDGGGLIDIRRNMLHVNGSAQLHSAEPTDSGERFSIVWFPIGSRCLAKERRSASSISRRRIERRRGLGVAGGSAKRSPSARHRANTGLNGIRGRARAFDAQPLRYQAKT